MVLLGLRTCLKEDIQASPAELVYGSPLRIPGEFFSNEEKSADPQIFVEKFRIHMRKLRPTITAHHIKPSMFILKDMYTCSHVVLRKDAVKQPLEAPYTGPYKVVRRLNDRVFIISINGKETSVTVDRLKSAFGIREGTEATQQQQQHSSQTSSCPEVEQHHFTLATPLKTYARTNKKTVSFLPNRNTATGGGVVVAVPTEADAQSIVPANQLAAR